jgi:PAS domain-containing protein
MINLTAESREDDIAEHARSPRVKRLLALWAGLARDGLPALTEMMEAGLGEMAEHYAILVPDGPHRFTYIHYGRAIHADSGVERAGRTTDELPAEIGQYLNQHYCRVMETGRPVHIVNVAHARPHVDLWERLVVPARTNGDLRLLVMLAEPHELRGALSSAVLEASPDAILAFRAVEDDLGTIYDARIVAANESACRMTRRSREQLLHAHLLQSFPQTRTNGIWELCLEVLETRGASRFDINRGLSNADGQFRVTLFPLHGGFAIMLQDITDLSGDAIPMIRRRVSNVKHFAAAAF